MSKQSDAKDKQGYTRELKTCGNCKNFKCDVVTTDWGYTSEKNLRCGLGEFKVHKTAVCNEHDRTP